MEDDIGIYYQISYIYFYVFFFKGFISSLVDDFGFGVIFCFGGYFDIEIDVVIVQVVILYFFVGYLIDQSDMLVIKVLIVQNVVGLILVFSNGILLVCDGYIQIKFGEKMYLESKVFYYKVDGIYDIKVIGVIIIDSDDYVMVKFGNGKNVMVLVGNGIGDFDLNVKKFMVKINGNDFIKIMGIICVVYYGVMENYFFGGQLVVMLVGIFMFNIGV